MSTETKILIVVAVLYLLGAAITVGYIANTAETRRSEGKPVFAGGPNADPAMQLAETALAWPFALYQSVGG